MDVEHAATCVAYLTSMTSGWNDDATEQLVYEFERLDNPDALADAIGKIARTWTSTGRVPLGVIMDAYQHEVKVADDRQHRAVKAVRCDGSGWLVRTDEAGTFEWPCTTCNPALARVWSDPEAKAKWRHGVATWRVLGFDDRESFDKEMARSSCTPDHGIHGDWCDGRDGMAIAVDAYRSAYDREPSKAIRSMIAAAAKPRTRREDF